MPELRSSSVRPYQPSRLPTPIPPPLPGLQRAVFYAALSPLVAFYLAFAALLYPLHGSLHLNGFYAATAALVPQGLHGLLKGEASWEGFPVAHGCMAGGGRGSWRQVRQGFV